MKKRILSLLLVLCMALSLFPTAAFAASTPEEALEEVDIYSGSVTLTSLMVFRRIQPLTYTYFYSTTSTGQDTEIPAYCVSPNEPGVPAVVGPGESVKYILSDRATDPKLQGILACGYPSRSVEELRLRSKDEAFYATKMALWCYLLSSWSIQDVEVNPLLSGTAREQAQRILAATREIYFQGTAWNEWVSATVTCTPDRSAAYPVTVNGQAYCQQIFTIHSATRCDVVELSLPVSAPAGTRLTDRNGQDIRTMTLTDIGDGYSGQFKVLYPSASVEGQEGNIQISLSLEAAQHTVIYALCAETDRYGNIQNYIADTDPWLPLELSAVSSYAANAPEDPPDTGLRILKYETGTDIPLSGARFEVIGPDGASVGTFATDGNGEILLPASLCGSYTVIEREAPAYHLLGAETTQTVTVEYGKVAEVTFYNEPYGSLRVEKKSDMGMNLSGVTIQIRNIATGATRTGKTGPGGSITFTDLAPGSYEVREISGIPGWQADTDTVQTVAVVTGETSTVTFINKELPGLRIIKYDRTTLETMAGITFEIWRDGESLGHFQTDQFGEILLLDVQPGTYLVKEVQSDDAHITETTPQQIELRAGDGIRQLVFFNDLKPGIHLTKVDSNDLSKPIPNAVFQIRSVAGDFGPEEFRTNEYGEIDLSKLPTGAYTITEKSCPGYIVDDAQRIIQLDGNENAQFVFTNSAKPSLYLKKLSSDGTALAGVSFRLAKIEDGSHYLDRTTDAQGEILWEGLEPGVYSLVETATTADHILDQTEHHVELFAGQTSTIVLENQKRPDLIVYKHDADTGEPIPDTVFQVKAADGHSVDEIRTDSTGKAVLENLLPGVYQITEKSVPSGWLLDAPSQLVTLYPNRDHTVYFEDHKKPGLTVQKVDSVTGAPIQGARFQVWYASNSTTSGELNDLGYYYSNEEGRFTVSNLRDGWYKISEVEPAAGYALKDPYTQEVYIKGGESKTVVFENTPLSALVVWKYDSVTGQAVEGAVFQVKYLSGTSGTGGTVIGTYKTSASGSFTVTGLSAGTYFVEELASDSGHVVDAAPKTAYISGKDQDVVQLYFGNSPKGALLVKKVDAATGKPLSDVEFLVTDSTGAVVGDAHGKFVTDSSGTFLVDGIVPGTTLVVKEIRARDGYLLDNTPQTVTVRAGQTVSLEFRNQPLGNLVIRKLDRQTGKPLAGVEFQITYADGSYLDNDFGHLSSRGLYRTDANGEIRISGVVGTLVITETRPLPGYVIDEGTRTQTVQVNPNDTQTITVYNTRMGGLIIIKKDEETGARIKGVQFEVRKLSGEFLGTYTTNANGVISLSEVEKGWYQVMELKAAKGYELDDTPHQIEVKDGGTATLEITNRQAGSALIHKIDSVTGEGIYGVKFLLSDAKGNPIGIYQSDDKGYVYIDKELADGRYTVREIECAEGYILDTQPKTFYVAYGGCTTITWKNTPITGQIQLTKTSADYNSMNGWPAGTPIPGTEFEIYDRAGRLVDTVRTDKNGIAVSRPLPLGRYQIIESKAADFYALDKTPLEVEIQFEGQIVRAAMLNKSLYTNVSIKKTGYVEVMPGQQLRYDFADISSNSNVSLSSFFWRDTLPTQAVRLDRIVTGTYNVRGNYKVVYRTNLSGGEYRVLADNLDTQRNYVLDASPTALGLASNEYITEFVVVFGTVPAGFRQVEAPRAYCTVLPGLTNGAQFTNQADVGGIYNGQWIMAVSRWVTRVYAPTKPLPRTGY